MDGDEEYQVDVEPVGVLLGEFTSLEGNPEDQSILLEDPNNAPTDILLLDNDQVEENAPAGTAVSSLTQVDEDDDDSFTFQLVDGGEGQPNDNGLFIINGTILFATAASLDYESNRRRSMSK